jgi:hypothetical protein
MLRVVELGAGLLDQSVQFIGVEVARSRPYAGDCLS